MGAAIILYPSWMTGSSLLGGAAFCVFRPNNFENRDIIFLKSLYVLGINFVQVTVSSFV